MKYLSKHTIDTIKSNLQDSMPRISGIMSDLVNAEYWCSRHDDQVFLGKYGDEFWETNFTYLCIILEAEGE